MKIPSETAARKFLEQTFPDCDVAILAGSSINKEITPQSDLDIVIIYEKQPSSYRQCFFCFDWKIEAFVYNRSSLSFAFEFSRLEGIPTIPRMCAEGIILINDGSAKEIQDEAKESLESGPVTWTEEEKDHLRFMITDLLDDLTSPINKKEKVFVAHKLFEVISEYVLRANNYWMGHGKWMFRSLRDYDEAFCEQLIQGFQIFIMSGNIEPFTTLIDKVLELHGGKLFEGYKETFF